ncbi:hypothetical protein IFO70_02290 [Phormidium tenue FACHB-886]|nr:hypothetical protein [Phormidium tenue FACHB-886]
MSYGKVQQSNSNARSQLKQKDRQWLKDNGYRNVGWENVIALYQKIEELLEKYPLEDMSLEELFLEAERIGSKYQTPAEIEEFNQQFSKEVAEIGELIDRQFPDTEVEMIDFGQTTAKKPQKKRNQKTYRTAKL